MTTQFDSSLNYKGKFLEHCQKNGFIDRPKVDFPFVSSKIFKCTVTWKEQSFESDEFSTKKSAEQHAYYKLFPPVDNPSSAFSDIMSDESNLEVPLVVSMPLGSVETVENSPIFETTNSLDGSRLHGDESNSTSLSMSSPGASSSSSSSLAAGPESRCQDDFDRRQNYKGRILELCVNRYEEPVVDVRDSPRGFRCSLTWGELSVESDEFLQKKVAMNHAYYKLNELQVAREYRPPEKDGRVISTKPAVSTSNRSFSSMRDSVDGIWDESRVEDDKENDATSLSNK
jgi:hypothetical protein